MDVVGPPQPFRTKWTLDVKNWRKIAILVCPPQPFRTKWTLNVKNWHEIAILVSPPQPFRTKWTLNVKNWRKTAILRCQSQPFRAKWTLDVKNWGKIAILERVQRCIQNNIVDIFLLWIWSCVHSLEIVFCDCSMFCRARERRGAGSSVVSIETL